MLRIPATLPLHATLHCERFVYSGVELTNLIVFSIISHISSTNSATSTTANHAERGPIMNKGRTSRPENDVKSKSLHKDDKIPTEEEIMSRPGTRDVLRVFHGWKKNESEMRENTSAASE